LDWVGSDPGRFAGRWKPIQFNSLVPNAEKRNVRPSAPKGAIDFEGLTARLKPRPFKTKSEPEFFRSLRSHTHPKPEAPGEFPEA
jgi:hypothetical protein